MNKLPTLTLGINANLGQFLHLLVQVMLVGFTIGMMRTALPALAETEFGVPRNSFMLLTAFVVGFGFVKGTLNFVAGRLAEQLGRQRVLVLGWLFAIPIPLLIYFAPSWNWIVAATLLLGVNQGLTWSMTQTSQLDLTRRDQRGLTLGLNEFAGYVGLALAGVISAYLATTLGTRLGILIFGLSSIFSALFIALMWIQDSRPWIHLHSSAAIATTAAAYPATDSTAHSSAHSTAHSTAHPTTRDIFWLMTWKNKSLMAICQAGLVEKFVDALVWVFYPIFLYQRGVSLINIGWITGLYGLVWGFAQLFTGKLSDHIGRQIPNVTGMWICGAGVAMMLFNEGVVWWSIAAAVSGFGMALLYPNLSAAIADQTPPEWRASAIGIYRFWRDIGYGIGALGLGITAHFTGSVDAAFGFVAIAMLLSGSLLLFGNRSTTAML